MTSEEEFGVAYPKKQTAIISEEDRDLGFGSKVSSESSLRMLNRDGSFNVRRTGINQFSSVNLYHNLLTMSWTQFLGIVLLLYFLSNIIFGFFYMLCGANALVDTSSEPMANAFLRSFFFSVQTFATIGYGTIHPVGILANSLVTLESYYSLLANALITGLVFARFARPTARIIFSETSVIAPYRGHQGFMFRLVNGRSNQLIEVAVKILFSRLVEENGQRVRRFDVLKLERENVSFLPLSWTIVHPIDEKSPMFDLNEQTCQSSDAEVLILLSAIDETFAQTVHARTSYKLSEIKFGYKFANLYNEIENGQPISIDIRKLSAVERAR